MSSSGCQVRNEGLQQLALGPAYHEWKNGTLTLTSTFEEEWPLYPVWMDDSCRHARSDFTKAAYWKGQVAIMIALLLFFSVGLQIFYQRREEPIFKFRRWENVLLFAVGCTAFILFSILEYMAAGSFPLRIQAYMFFSLSAYLSMHYIVKAIQLLFVYHWNRAKVESTKLQSDATLKRFKFMSFVLNRKFYFMACGIGVLLLGIVPAVIVTQNDLWLDSGDVEYSSVRCNWFQIPDKYTSATTNSSACACVNNYYLKESAYVSGCETVLSSCSSALNNGLVAEFCDVCSSAYDEACITWLYNTFTSGECGFPSRVPHFSSCVSSIFADTVATLLINIISVALTFVNVVLIIPLLWMKDCLGMTTEILLGLLLCFMYYLMFFVLPYVWNNSYPSALFTAVICTWALLCVPVYFPIFFDWHSKRFGVEKSIHILHEHSTQQLESVNAIKIHGGELDTCLDTPALLAVYESFTVQEFSAESLRFLVEYKKLMMIQAEVEFVEEAQRLMLRFINHGAVMEVNISDKIRSKIIASLDSLLNRPNFEPNMSKLATDQAEILESLVSAFNAAYEQVRFLVITSSWPNFKRSNLFDKYKVMEKRIFALDKQVNPLWPKDDHMSPRKALSFKYTKQIVSPKDAEAPETPVTPNSRTSMLDSAPSTVW